MAKELHAGISFGDDTAQTVLLEIQGPEVKLWGIEEHPKDRFVDYWFLDDLLSLDRKTLSRVSRVAVALDHHSAFCHRFPLDNSLNQVDQNDQVQWELSHYIANYKLHDYINDVRILRTRAREQMLDVLVATVHRSFVFGLHELLAEEKLDLQTVEVSFYAAENSVLSTYPDLKSKNCALVGISKQRVETGMLTSGRLSAYAARSVVSFDDAHRFLENSFVELDLSNIILYGTSQASEWIDGVRSVFGSRVSMLNPFRNMQVASSCRNFDEFAGNEHRFAASVGCVLRK